MAWGCDTGTATIGAGRATAIGAGRATTIGEGGGAGREAMTATGIGTGTGTGSGRGTGALTGTGAATTADTGAGGGKTGTVPGVNTTADWVTGFSAGVVKGDVIGTGAKFLMGAGGDGIGSEIGKDTGTLGGTCAGPASANGSAALIAPSQIPLHPMAAHESLEKALQS